MINVIGGFYDEDTMSVTDNEDMQILPLEAQIIFEVSQEINEKYFQTGSEISYEVQPGDTLSGLFGDGWEAVASYNHIENPDMIYVGQEIQIPTL